MTRALQRELTTKQDGRYLIYYGWRDADGRRDASGQPKPGERDV